jgi:tRNA dimethylallyltransferase
MATGATKPKLVVIVGPTASGKSDLAMFVAEKLDGEIIAADSRTVYKGMDIGTAKPSKADQKAIPHWGLDLIEPGKSFNAAQYKSFAQAKITEVQRRNKLPILVGGTGLYIDAVIFDFGFKNAADPKLRQQLEELSISDLQSKIHQLKLDMPDNRQNKRYLIRKIELQGETTTRLDKPVSGTLITGIDFTPLQLKQRINDRIEANFENLVEETKKLVNTYGREQLMLTAGIPYSAAIDFTEANKTKVQAIEVIKIAEWQYARRQKTWLKRNKFINWFDSPENAEKFILQRFGM